MSMKVSGRPRAKGARKGPAFWTDETGETQKVRRDPFAPLAQPAWDIHGKALPPPKLFGLFSWWQLSSTALVLLALVLFFFLINLIATYMVEADTMTSEAPLLQYSEDRLKEAVRRHLSARRPSVCNPCQDSWMQWGDTCYLGTPQKMTWHKCIPYCEAQGASLLVGRTEGEIAFLLIESAKWLAEEYNWRIPGNYWVGLAYNSTLGIWHWMDGRNLHLKITAIFKKYILDTDFCVLFARGVMTIKECTSANHCLCKKVVQ